MYSLYHSGSCSHVVDKHGALAQTWTQNYAWTHARETIAQAKKGYQISRQIPKALLETRHLQPTIAFIASNIDQCYPNQQPIYTQIEDNPKVACKGKQATWPLLP
jgi:hypothetical protein